MPLWPEGVRKAHPQRAEIVDNNERGKREKEKVEKLNVGKRDPRSACERGGGAAVNIVLGGWDDTGSKVFAIWEGNFVLRAWVGGASKTKILFPFLMVPVSAEVFYDKGESRRLRRDEAVNI